MTRRRSACRARRALASGAALAALCAAPRAESQVSFTNVLLPRFGRDPDDALVLPPDLVPSASRASFFDQLSLDWRRDALRLGFRFETYQASDTLATHYAEFVRRWASWSTEQLDVTVGNYEVLFGRGLAVRAFELPGVVREEFGTPQFGDSRDLDGGLVEGRGRRWELTAFSGQPRRSDQDPTQERRGLATGAGGVLHPLRGLDLGAHYVRLDAQGTGPGSRPEIAGALVRLRLDPLFERAGLAGWTWDSYAEYDQVNGLAVPAAVSSPRASPEDGYMLYTAQSIVADSLPGRWRWGVSWELKDYQNYELGINEPPALVREHSYVLLNRTTHVADPLQEHGYQLESLWNWNDTIDLVVNWSRAENQRSRRFRETYGEIAAHHGGRRVALFAATSSDGNDGVEDRDTFGAHGMLPVRGPHGLEIEVDSQTTTRTDGTSFEDRYGSIAWSWAGWLSLAASRQTTDDPREATDPVTGERYRRAYDVFTARATFDEHHDFQLQWGRQRPGIACVAGTCYRVRGFEGVTAQIVSRF